MKKKGFILPLALIAGMLVGCDTGNSNNGSNNNNNNSSTNLKEKEEINGLKLLSVEENVSAQYNWEEYAKRTQSNRYYYYDRGTSKDNNVEVLDPSQFIELESSSSSSRKDVKKSAKKVSVRQDSASGEHEQFVGILNEDQFFALTSLLPTAVKDNTSMSAHAVQIYDYVYFEIDAGYKSSTIDMTYNVYDNDVITQVYNEDQEVAIDDQYEEHKTVTSKSKSIINNQLVDGVNNFVQVVHALPKDGESEPELKDGEKYSIPDNYRVMQANASKEPVKEFFNFQMRDAFVELLSKDKYNGVDSDGNLTFDKYTEWFSSEKDEDGNITLQYNHDVYYDEGTTYAGQGVVETIYAKLDSTNRLLEYGYVFNFTYYGESLQTYDMKFSYGYEEIGDYNQTAEEKAIFDYNKYYDNGTLIPTIADGNKHAEAEDLLEQLNDSLIADEVNEPTGLVREQYYYQNLSSKTEEKFSSDSTLYNDGILVTFFSQMGTDESGETYAESGTIQQFNQDGNNYQIQKFYGTSRYSNGKVTTPYNEGEEPNISLLDAGIIRDIRTIYKNSKKTGSTVTTKLTAELVPEGIDEETNETVKEHYVLTLQACIQQSISDDTANLGYVYTYKVSFRIINK